MHIKSIAIAIVVAAFPAQASYASGSYSEIRPSQPDWQSAPDPYQAAYDTGRRTLKRHVTCKKCLFPDGVKDRETAFKVLDHVQAGDIVLSEEKQQALALFLDRRFKLSSGN